MITYFRIPHSRVLMNISELVVVNHSLVRNLTFSYILDCKSAFCSVFQNIQTFWTKVPDILYYGICIVVVG